MGHEFMILGLRRIPGLQDRSGSWCNFGRGQKGNLGRRRRDSLSSRGFFLLGRDELFTFKCHLGSRWTQKVAANKIASYLPLQSLFRLSRAIKVDYPTQLEQFEMNRNSGGNQLQWSQTVKVTDLVVELPLRLFIYCRISCLLRVSDSKPLLNFN